MWSIRSKSPSPKMKVHRMTGNLMTLMEMEKNTGGSADSRHMSSDKRKIRNLKKVLKTKTEMKSLVKTTLDYYFRERKKKTKRKIRFSNYIN